MPNINVSVPQTDAFLSYEISSDFSLGDLKGLISADTGFSIETVWLMLDGRPLSGNDSQTLTAAGINDDAMLVCGTAQSPRQGQPQQQPQQQPQAAAAQQPQGSQMEAEIDQLRQRLLNQAQNPQGRQQLKNDAPELEASLSDPAGFRRAYIAFQRRKQAEEEALNNDFSEEGQAKIYERIRRENVANEQEKTMRENPELFVRVTMLYVDLEVNGHPVKALVDSGAQTTILSAERAEACQITHLIDTRYQGIAKGVGTGKILGRVHRAKMRIGDADDLACQFTVMEGKNIDMLLGLDMLKRHQACIDLQRNQLVLAGGSVRVPFLPESEIPDTFQDEMDKEPHVAGPDGTVIGTESGAIKPASAAAGQAVGQSAAAAASSSSRPPVRNQPGPPRPPAPAAPAPAAAPAPTSGQSEFPQASIDVLQNLGASREQAIEMLRMCNGNVDYAAGLLFDQ